MIFDDEHFFTGGYIGSSARGESKPLYIKHATMGEAYSQYFDYLWIKSKLLNEKQGIHWDVLHQCGLEVGYSNSELNAVITKIAEETDLKNIQLLPQENFAA